MFFRHQSSNQMILFKRVVVLGQLVEWFLPTTVIWGSNTVSNKINLLSIVLKIKKKETEDVFLKKMLSIS